MEPHAVDAGQGDELVLVAERRQFALEPGDGGVVQVLPPVERGRAVVGQQLVRMLPAHAFGEGPRDLQVRGAGLAPHQVGVGRVGEAARDRLLHAAAHPVEALGRAFAGQERLVVLVEVRGQQARGLGVGARQHHGRRAEDVGGQSRGDQLLHRLLGRHQHLAAHVAALLDRRQLVLEVRAGGAGGDHVLHQLEGVQHAAEAGFGVGHDRREVVDPVRVARARAARPLDLVGALEGVVDAPHHGRHRVVGVQGLVRVHGLGGVAVGGDLPAGQVDRLDAGLHLLHRLAAGQRAEAVDVALAGFAVEQAPEFLRAVGGGGVGGHPRAAQAHHVLGGIAAADSLPARVGAPVLLEGLDLLLPVHARPLAVWRVG